MDTKKNNHTHPIFSVVSKVILDGIFNERFKKIKNVDKIDNVKNVKKRALNKKRKKKRFYIYVWIQPWQ